MKHARSAGRTPASGTGSSDDDASSRSQSSVGDPPCEVALDDDHLRTGVGQLVTQEVALVRGVDRHLDRAELQSGEEADDLGGTILQEGGHAVALADSELAERASEPV